MAFIDGRSVLYAENIPNALFWFLYPCEKSVECGERMRRVAAHIRRTEQDSGRPHSTQLLTYVFHTYPQGSWYIQGMAFGIRQGQQRVWSCHSNHRFCIFAGATHEYSLKLEIRHPILLLRIPQFWSGWLAVPWFGCASYEASVLPYVVFLRHTKQTEYTSFHQWHNNVVEDRAVGYGTGWFVGRVANSMTVGLCSRIRNR